MCVTVKTLFMISWSGGLIGVGLVSYVGSVLKIYFIMCMCVLVSKMGTFEG